MLGLPRWSAGFTVWGAGRDGKNFVSELGEAYRGNVKAMCDIDAKKVGTEYFNPRANIRLPIIHFSEAKPPLVMCVAMGRTAGAFEANVASLGLQEGVDYFHFS